MTSSKKGPQNLPRCYFVLASYNSPRGDTVLPGGHSEWEPPDTIPNSEVKLLSADDSMGPPHAKVGHRQVLNCDPCKALRGFLLSSLFFCNTLHRLKVMTAVL